MYRNSCTLNCETPVSLGTCRKNPLHFQKLPEFTAFLGNCSPDRGLNPLSGESGIFLDTGGRVAGWLSGFRVPSQGL